MMEGNTTGEIAGSKYISVLARPLGDTLKMIPQRLFLFICSMG